MSQTGELVFFTETRLPQPENSLGYLLTASQTKKFKSAFRTLEEDRSWESFLRTRDEPLQSYVVVHEASDLGEKVGDGMTLSEIPSLYRDGRSLSVSIGACPLAGRVEQAVKAGVADDIRSDFLPCELTITIGFHDIFDCSEHDAGFLFGRAFLSISFSGYGCAADFVSMRESTFSLEVIRHIKKELELITGPLKECMYWNF
jgi:hypothetical protein